MDHRRLVFAFVGFALWCQPLVASRQGDELAARWQGAWVIVRPEVASGCAGAYTDNEVRGERTTGRGEFRFGEGELARVEKLDLDRKKVEVFIILGENLLVPTPDGPFTLYDDRSCRVELEIPRVGGEDEDLHSLLATVLERYTGEREARAARTWNGRVREPYPGDYEETLASHRRWKAEQLNVAVAEKRDLALEEAGRLLDRFSDDPDYHTGFAAGVDHARRKYFGDCPTLVSASVYNFTSSPPSGKTGPWCRGFEDGQALVFHLEVGRRLGRCFVPVE